MALAVTVFRFLLGFVFLSAGVPKLCAMSDFERTVARYDLLPPSLVRPVSRLLPPLECGCAIALFAGFAVPLVSAVVGALLACFALAIGVNLLRGRPIECGCSGRRSGEPISWWTVLRNLVLVAFAAVTVAQARHGGLSLTDQIAALVTAASALMVLALARQGLEVRIRLSRLSGTNL